MTNSWLVLFVILASYAYAECVDRPYEGYGAITNGALDCPTGFTNYTVTSSAYSGPGTLLDAVSEDCRYITFNITEPVSAASTINTEGNYLTIDGTNAPLPTNIIFSGSSGAALSIESHDVVLRNIRIRESNYDGLRIHTEGVYNILVDHCSFTGSGDGNADTTIGVHDITFQWNIFGDNPKNQLIKYSNPDKITLHHNLYIGDTRNPQLHETTNTDMTNNVIFDWGTYGTELRTGSNADLINNYFLPGSGSSQNKCIYTVSPGEIYMEGNIKPTTCTYSGTTGSTRTSFPYVLTMTSAEHALVDVYHEAGACPRDSTDEAYIATLLNNLPNNITTNLCDIGQEITDTCMCNGEPYYQGYCCEWGWQEIECTSSETCGDGTCEGTEDCTSCETDCGACSIDCVHSADLPVCDGCVDTTELSAYIGLWKSGTVEMDELMSAIGFWKQGC